MIFLVISLIFQLVFLYIVLNELFIRITNPRNDSYNRYKCESPFRNVKFLLSFALVSLQHRRTRKRHLADEANRIQRMERPQELEQFGVYANDAIAFTGSDEKGNQVLLRYGRRQGGIAEFWLLLKLVDENGQGTVYTHPEHPNAILFDAQENAYAAGGLRFEIIEPMKKWRIRYNGWMRKGFRNTANHDILDGLIPVKFNFEWTAISKPFQMNDELDAGLIGAGMADQSWSKEFFEQLREHSARGNETRYEQWGEISGQITLNNHETVQVRVRGMRDHNSGPRDWQQYGRYTANMGITSSGNFFHVGAVSMREGLKHLVYGYVGDSSGQLSPVTSCSIELARLGDDRMPPNEFTMSFSTGLKTHFARIQVQDRIPVFNGLDWPSHSNLHFIKIYLDGEIGYGFSEFEYKNLHQRPADRKAVQNARVFPHEIEIALLTKQELDTTLALLGHRLGLCRDLVGLQTQQMTQLWQIQGQFSVPKGVILLPAAFRSGRNEQPAAFFAKTASKVREIFAHDLLDDEVSKSLTHRSFTVSLSGKDSVPVRRFENVSDVGQVFSSSDFKSFLDHKIDKSYGYSIMLQERISGDVFGHMWTCDPKSKSPTVMHVTIVERGKNQTKDFILHRSYNDHLSPSTPIGGGNEGRVTKLAHLALQLEKTFRSPRYIEYAEHGGIIYILECRDAEE